uniref:potassium channel family protein n=1 Tax=uncultured Sphingomonas sp. TaxID=158754 RepID=UPI0025CC3F93|nr:potassium channel family protein [uncultured Sphingomonas sp.]
MSKLQAATDTLKELAAIYAAVLLTAALLFMAVEARPFGESFYWAATTATSTGYGDIAPRTAAGQLLAVVLMHVSIFGIAPLIIVRLIERLNQDRDAFTHEEQVHILEGIARIEQRLQRLEERPGTGAEVPPYARVDP